MMISEVARFDQTAVLALRTVDSRYLEVQRTL